MLPLPPPPSPPPPPPETPPWRRFRPVSFDQIVLSKQSTTPKTPTTPKTDTVTLGSRKQSILRQPRGSRTNPWIWFGAVLCLIFSLLLIFFGVATLIVFVAIKPRIPVFDTPVASLNTIYFDTPEYFNGDFGLLANFSNPNRKIDVRFEYLVIDLFFSNRLIATSSSQSFTLRKRETKLEPIHLISSLVYLPQNHAVALKRQVQNNRIEYEIRGTFKVRAYLGMIHFTYWMHGRCQLQMTGPPTGILVSRRCSTRR